MRERGRFRSPPLGTQTSPRKRPAPLIVNLRWCLLIFADSNGYNTITFIFSFLKNNIHSLSTNSSLLVAPLLLCSHTPTNPPSLLPTKSVRSDISPKIEYHVNSPLPPSPSILHSINLKPIHPCFIVHKATSFMGYNCFLIIINSSVFIG